MIYRRVMTVPVIDGIDANTWEYRSVYGTADRHFRWLSWTLYYLHLLKNILLSGIFEWGLLYKETAISDAERTSRPYNSMPFRWVWPENFPPSLSHLVKGVLVCLVHRHMRVVSSPSIGFGSKSSDTTTRDCRFGAENSTSSASRYACSFVCQHENASTMRLLRSFISAPLHFHECWENWM